MLRWPALIARLDPQHRSRQQFLAVFKMEPETYMDLAYALQDMVTSGIVSVAPGFFAPLVQRHGAAVSRFVTMLSRDLPALRAELRKDSAQAVSGRGELEEFPYLQRFPLLRDDRGSLRSGHPVVLAQGLEASVDLQLSAMGGAYIGSFSEVFENYVLELLRDAGPPELIDEKQYWTALGQRATTVDAIWREPDATVLIEAKMALFGDQVVVTGAPLTIKGKLVRVAEAVAQGWGGAQALSKPGHPLFDGGAGEFFQLIVVSRELFVGTGQLLSQLLGPQALAPVSAGTLPLLPLERIFIVSIEEFEQLMGAVRDGETGLVGILRRVAADNADPARSSLLLEDHLRRYGPRPSPAPLLQQASDQCARRSEAMVEDAEDHLSA